MLLLLALICLTNIFSTAIVQTLVVALTVVVISSLLTDPSLSIQRTPLDQPYLAFVLARVISLLLSQYPDESLPALHIEFFYYVVFFLVTQSVRRNEPAVVSALVSLFLGAGLVAALIATLKVGLEIAPRGSSTTAGPYTLGAYLCAALPLALLYPRPPRLSFYRNWVVPVGLCLGIVSTFDRLHWACMALIIVIAGMLTRKRALMAGLCVVLALSLLYPSVRVRLGQVSDASALLNGRDILWRGAALLIDDHPLAGFGPRTFRTAIRRAHLYVSSTGSSSPQSTRIDPIAFAARRGGARDVSQRSTSAAITGWPDVPAASPHSSARSHASRAARRTARVPTSGPPRRRSRPRRAQTRTTHARPSRRGRKPQYRQVIGGVVAAEQAPTCGVQPRRAAPGKRSPPPLTPS